MISIIIPVYNTPRPLLKRALDSLLLQDVEMEALLIDDGSESATASHLDMLACDEVKVFHKPNGGVSSARNLGLDNATGDYIAFMDPDDELVPGYLASALKLLVETGADAVFGGMKYLYPDGKAKIDSQSFEGEASYRVIGPDEVSCLERSMFDKASLSEIGLSPIQYVSNCGALFTRETIGDVRFREDIAISEDRVFNFEVLERSSNLILAGGYWYIYHQNPDSASHSIRLSAADDLKATARAYADLISRYQLSDKVTASIDMGMLECFFQAIFFCVFDSDFKAHFGLARKDFVISLLGESEFAELFVRVNPTGTRWKVLAALCRAKAARSIVLYMYAIQGLKALKKALTYSR